MADSFEVADIKPAQEQLHVSIERDSWSMQTVNDFTHISAEPPIAEGEVEDIKYKIGLGDLSGKGLSRLARANIANEPVEGVYLTLDGELNTAKIKFGIAFTEALMSLRGINTAVVSVDGDVAHHIRRKSETDQPTAPTRISDFVQV